MRIGQKVQYIGATTRRAGYGETVHSGDNAWVVSVGSSSVKLKTGNGCTCVYGTYTVPISEVRA